MRRSELISFAALAIIGISALVAGRYGAMRLQETVTDRAEENLAVLGFSEIDVAADGLVVEVSGEVRSVRDRDVVVGTLKGIEGMAALVDNLIVVHPLMDSTPLQMTIQRDTEALTLSGDAPNIETRDLLAAQASLQRGEAEFLNLMKAQDRSAAAEWFLAAEAAIDTVAALRVGRGDVVEGRVAIIGAAMDGDQRDALIASLQRRLPAGFEASLEISAPPPLLSPYVFKAELSEAGITVQECAAPDTRLQSVILGALRSTGYALLGDGHERCIIAHGAPNERWTDAVERAVVVLTSLREGTVELVDDDATIRGFIDKGEDVAGALAAIEADWPEAYSVSASLREILPVVRPFTLTAVKRPGETLFSGFATSEEEVLQWHEILGLEPPSGPIVSADGQRPREGLALARGAPADWNAATGVALRALASLKLGAVTAVDSSYLIAAPGDLSERKQLELELREQLPQGVNLEVIAADEPRFVAGRTDADSPPIVPSNDRAFFVASASRNRPLILRGVVDDPTTLAAVVAYARAKFGGDATAENLAVLDAVVLPIGWQRALFASLDALERLEEGEAMIEPGAAYLRGTVASAGQGKDALAMLEQKTPDDFLRFSRLKVVERVEVPALEEDETLPADRCLERLALLLRQKPVTFESNSSVIAPTSYGTLDDLADVLQRCPDSRFEIAGYTDSRGSSADNQSLSQKRAGQVRVALIRRTANATQLTARGFGETNPIASNDTAQGRARNRRIEFSILR